MTCQRCDSRISPVFSEQLTDAAFYEEGLCTKCGGVTKLIYDQGIVAATDFYEFFRSK